MVNGYKKISFDPTYYSKYEIERAQRDSNPRPTASQAAILSKLNYGPNITTFCRP